MRMGDFNTAAQARGKKTFTSVPADGLVSTSSRPPTSSARSRMLTSP